MKVEDHQREGEKPHETLQRILGLYGAVQTAWRGFWTRGGASPHVAKDRGEGSLAWLLEQLTEAFGEHDGFEMEAASTEDQRLCVYCGEPVPDKHNAQVQVVFDGWKEHGKGKLAKKRPGRVIYWHNVCELPEEDDG